MKKALVSLVVIAALGGAGFFAWTKFFAPGLEASATTAPRVAAEPGYVEIERLTAPFIRGGEYVQYVVLDLRLEVSSDRAAATVRQLAPRLQDAFIGEMHQLARIRPADQRLLNVARVKARLRAGAERVLGPDVVTDVLVQVAR